MKGLTQSSVLSLTEKLQYLYLSQKFISNLGSKSFTLDLDNYYVPPNLHIVEPNIENNIPISSENIFPNIKDDSQEYKILIEGGFGTGKTILLQEIAYKWARLQRFNDKFDFVFRIKLKLLLSYTRRDIDDNELAYFIYHSISKISPVNIPKEYRISIEEIKEVLKSSADKILFLIDDDNDIINLLYQEDTRLINEIFCFKNIIMTSRPNNIPRLFKNQFNQFMELSGFSLESAKEYISKYFINQRELLITGIRDAFRESPPHIPIMSYLSSQKDPVKYEIFGILRTINRVNPIGLSESSAENAIEEYYKELESSLRVILQDPNIEDIITNPMSAYMFCVVFSDPNSRDGLSEHLTVAKLYQEMMLLLARRESIENGHSTWDRIKNSPQTNALKEISFEGVKNSNLIDGNSINIISEKYNLDLQTIYKLGLLRIAVYNSDYESNDIEKHKHTFARLSIQDYLSALLLKDRLESNDEVVFTEASNFIAEHRSESKFLTILKFVAELISKESNIDSLTRFWEAVTCNIDGVLELGADKKVSLLMKLLGCAKIKGQIDTRIPNLQKIIEFIDKIILPDIFKWSKAIKESGYLSESMRLYLWSYFSEKNESLSLMNSNEKINLISIMMNTLVKSDLEEILKLTKGKLLSQEAQYKEFYIKLLVKIIISKKIDDSSLVTILLNLLGDKNLSEEAIEGLKTIAINNPKSINNYFIIEALFNTALAKNLGALLSESVENNESDFGDIILENIITHAQAHLNENYDPSHKAKQSILELLKHKELKTCVLEILGKHNIAIKSSSLDNLNNSKKVKSKAPINDLNVSKVIPWEDNILLMLKSLSSGISEDSSEFFAAKGIIKSKISDMSEKNLEWIILNFDELLETYGDYAIELMQDLYHHALLDESISKVESIFIIKCITILGFNNIISNPKINNAGNIEYSILFDNKKYIFIGEENLKYLESFASTALFTGRDQLSTQYINNEPLFPNTGSGIKIAASDIKECRSIVDEEILGINDWHVSLLYRSNHKKSAPYNIFLLVERRILGNYVVDQIYLKNGKIAKLQYSSYPDSDEIDKLRAKIFDDMVYSETEKPRYFGKSFNIKANIGEALLIQSEIEGQDDFSIANFSSDEEKEADLETETNTSILAYLYRMKAFAGINVFNRLTSNNSPHSPNVKLQVIDINLFLSFLKKSIPDKLNEIKITGEWLNDQELLEEYSKDDLLKSDYSRESMKVDVSDIKLFLKNIDINKLQAIVKKEDHRAEVQEQITLIESDPYKYAFYQALIWQLNSVYIASSSIATQMVNGVDNSLAGKIGSILGGVSAHTPLVGVGVALLGEIFNGVGKFVQDLKIDNYAHLVKDSHEMAKLAEKIARNLAMSELQIKPEETNLEDLVSNALEITTIATIVTNICHAFNDRANSIKDQNQPKDLVDYAQRFIEGPQKGAPDLKSKGENDAMIVAKKLIKDIFAGKYSKISKQSLTQSSLNAKASAINEDLVEFYKSDENRLPSSTTVIEQQKKECCTIMRVEVDSYKNQEFVEKIEKLAKLYILANGHLTSLEIEKFRNIIKDEDIEELLLSAKDENEQKDLLNLLFSKKDKVIEDIEIIKNSLEQIDLSEQVGLNQHIYNALSTSSNYIYKYSREVISTIAKLTNYLEDLLNDPEHNVNDVAIRLLQLNDLFDFAASGIQNSIPLFRPPYFDPDGDGSYGPSGGGNSGENSNGNNQTTVNEIYMPIMIGLNFTNIGNDH